MDKVDYKVIEVENWSSTISKNFYERIFEIRDNTSLTRNDIKELRKDLERYFSSIIKRQNESKEDRDRYFRWFYFFGFLHLGVLAHIASKL